MDDQAKRESIVRFISQFREDLPEPYRSKVGEYITWENHRRRWAQCRAAFRAYDQAPGGQP